MTKLQLKLPIHTLTRGNLPAIVHEIDIHQFIKGNDCILGEFTAGNGNIISAHWNSVGIRRGGNSPTDSLDLNSQSLLAIKNYLADTKKLF